MKKILNKKSLIILFFLGIVILFILILINSIRNGVENGYYTSEYNVDRDGSAGEFTILEFFPEATQVRTMERFYSFRVTFSAPVDINSVRVSVQPETELKIEPHTERDDILWIGPLNGWDYNKNYRVIIESAESVTGGRLKEQYMHELYLEESQEPNIY